MLCLVVMVLVAVVFFLRRILADAEVSSSSTSPLFLFAPGACDLFASRKLMLACLLAPPSTPRAVLSGVEDVSSRCPSCPCGTWLLRGVSRRTWPGAPSLLPRQQREQRVGVRSCCVVSSACRTFPPSSLEAPRPKIPRLVFVALVDWSVAPPPRFRARMG